MKTASAPVHTMLKNDVEVVAQVKMFAEWEHNRFSEIDNLTVSPAQAEDIEWLSIYDLDSITMPSRPSAGIAKSRFDSDTRLPVVKKYRDTPNQSRYYISTPRDTYKYWSSTQKTGTTNVGGRYAFSSPIVLTLLYKNPVLSNKLVVGFETSYAFPGAFTIEVTYNGTVWVPVPATALNSEGQVVLYRNTNNNWSTTKSYNGQINMRGIRLTVNSMNESKSHVDVIQMGLRLEQDLSELVEDYSAAFDISDRSFVTPLGISSSNTASVTLSNTDFRFNNETSLLYKGLIGKRVKFTCELWLNAAGHGGGTEEKLREFTMWSDMWGGQQQVTSVVELKDSSVFLQEIKTPEVYWEDVTVGAIIWQLMDISGMNNYQYSRHVLDNSQVIPYFYPDPDIPVWEQIGRLAEATQTAVYFDEYDVMQIKTRSAMFDTTEGVDWSLDAVPNGQKLPDIVSGDTQEELATNKVTIDYRPAKYSEWNNGNPKMETVWEPEESTVVLRSAPLVKDLLATGQPWQTQQMFIRQADAVHWPYESMVNIRGEILRYRGKEYMYYNSSGVLTPKFVYNQEEKDALDDKSHPDLAWKNYFSGKLIVAERGMMGSGVSSHKITGASYSGVITGADNTYMYAWGGGFVRKDGYAQVTNTADANSGTYHIMRHETAVTGTYIMLGARIRFPRGGNQAGGIWFDGNSLDIGYYLELATTEHIDTIEKRATRHELSLSVAKNNVDRTRIVSHKGAQHAIAVGVWYDLDIVYHKASGSITVYLDGVFAGRWDVPVANRPITNEGRFGPFVRGKSQVDFEYIYSTADLTAGKIDQSSVFDLRSGGFTSGYIKLDWKYDVRYFNAYYHGTRRYYPQQISRSNYALDEFGPVVHEMREYDIKFEDNKVPVQHSSLYMSNTSQVSCIVYTSTAFGARFILVNTSRENAIVQGEDSVTFDADNTINQKMFIYGRTLYQDEEKSITKSDDASIRKNGEAEVVFDNRFIQSEAMAKALADWVVKIWAGPVDELSVEIFGNPLLQLGDVVTMNWPTRGMDPTTHKYFVVFRENSYREGLVTKLILRRARF